ncbi:hypothetical protein DL93DRAFT_2163516 [Clavulina sp. PMI_390]|nr:hypothetical protein DL93DRAFT_2163516 [Clavulina sp. PMI_390]
MAPPTSLSSSTSSRVAQLGPPAHSDKPQVIHNILARRAHDVVFSASQTGPPVLSPSKLTLSYHTSNLNNIMGSIISAIGRAIEAVIAAITSVIMAIVGGITTVRRSLFSLESSIKNIEASLSLVHRSYSQSGTSSSTSSAAAVVLAEEPVQHHRRPRAAEVEAGDVADATRRF